MAVLIFAEGKNTMIFNEETIQGLFGNEAAENETPARLKEYYVKSAVYEQVASSNPLRILVGHKGIGKSALFKIAISEDADRGDLTIFIRPDDIVSIAAQEKPILELIRDWKTGLLGLLAEKAYQAFGVSPGNQHADIRSWGTRVLEFLTNSVKLKSAEISLNPAKKALLDHFLKRGLVFIYIDDLDRGWEGKIHDIRRISALLNAVRDLASDNDGLKFRISLRSDVFFLVRTSDESTDKIEGSVIWHSWTNHEILVLLVKRIETFKGRSFDEREGVHYGQQYLSGFLDGIFESRFNGSGLWDNAPMYRVLMSVIRKRPRDLVKLCTAAARQAAADRSQVIATNHLKAVFDDYSQGRLQDTVNEYRTELPDIQRLLLSMRPTKREKLEGDGYKLTTNALLAKIEKALQTGAFRFANGRNATRQDLAGFLYKINFLTARKELPNGLISRRYFEENRYLAQQFADFGFDWEIHPAYRWALQPDDLSSIYHVVRLSDIEEPSVNK
ncbi:MAG TPA: hypothetical protein VHC44_16825 [Verrucomicrobiae bacterium]|nr:hypothetical protein [Verrucomicrobiae bacterium]